MLWQQLKAVQCILSYTTLWTCWDSNYCPSNKTLSFQSNILWEIGAMPMSWMPLLPPSYPWSIGIGKLLSFSSVLGESFQCTPGFNQLCYAKHFCIQTQPQLFGFSCLCFFGFVLHGWVTVIVQNLILIASYDMLKRALAIFFLFGNLFIDKILLTHQNQSQYLEPEMEN